MEERYWKVGLDVFLLHPVKGLNRTLGRQRPGVNLISRDHTADWVYSPACPDPTPAEELRSIYNRGAEL